MISNQIAISNGENNIQAIIKIAKNIFKLNYSEEDILKVISFNKHNSNKKQEQKTEKQDQFTEESIIKKQKLINEKQSKFIDEFNQESVEEKKINLLKNLLKCKI